MRLLFNKLQFIVSYSLSYSYPDPGLQLLALLKLSRAGRQLKRRTLRDRPGRGCVDRGFGLRGRVQQYRANSEQTEEEEEEEEEDRTYVLMSIFFKTISIRSLIFSSRSSSEGDLTIAPCNREYISSLEISPFMSMS